MTEVTITTTDGQSSIAGRTLKIVKISGQLDESNVDQKIQDVYKLLEETPKNLDLIFDLEELEYMNSKSIGYLTDLYGKITENGGKVALAKAKPNIQDILQVVGLTQLVQIFDSIELAKQEISGGTATAPDLSNSNESVAQIQQQNAAQPQDAQVIQPEAIQPTPGVNPQVQPIEQTQPPAPVNQELTQQTIQQPQQTAEQSPQVQANIEPTQTPQVESVQPTHSQQEQVLQQSTPPATEPETNNNLISDEPLISQNTEQQATPTVQPTMEQQNPIAPQQTQPTVHPPQSNQENTAQQGQAAPQQNQNTDNPEGTFNLSA